MLALTPNPNPTSRGGETTGARAKAFASNPTCMETIPFSGGSKDLGIRVQIR